MARSMSATSPVPSVVRSTVSSCWMITTPSPVSWTLRSSMSTPAFMLSPKANIVEPGNSSSPPVWASTSGRSRARRSVTVAGGGRGRDRRRGRRCRGRRRGRARRRRGSRGRGLRRGGARRWRRVVVGRGRPQQGDERQRYSGPRRSTARSSAAAHESQIGPNAGMPRDSRPCTTCHVTPRLAMQITASAPDDTNISWVGRGRRACRARRCSR